MPQDDDEIPGAVELKADGTVKEQPNKKRGRPPGSKNKPKPAPAEGVPAGEPSATEAAKGDLKPAPVPTVPPAPPVPVSTVRPLAARRRG